MASYHLGGSLNYRLGGNLKVPNLHLGGNLKDSTYLRDSTFLKVNPRLNMYPKVNPSINLYLKVNPSISTCLKGINPKVSTQVKVTSHLKVNLMFKVWELYLSIINPILNLVMDLHILSLLRVNTPG